MNFLRFCREKFINKAFPILKYNQDRKNQKYENVTFLNFWEGFEAKSFRFTEFIKVKNLNPEKKPIDFFSTFWPRSCLKYSQNIKIFFTGEYIWKERYAAYDNYCLDDTHLSIGFRDIVAENYIRFPLWLYGLISPYHTSLEEIQTTLKKIEEKNQYKFLKQKFCCLIARHDMNGMRTHIYNQLENIAPIDCPSSLLHNIDIELSYRREDKIKLLHNYTFTICPENIVSKGYVTEKLADAFMGGAIPIYQGYLNNFDKSIINEKRIIFWDESSTQLIEQLYTNPCTYQNFVKEPIFLPNAAENIFQHIQTLEKKLESLFISS